MGAQEKYGKVHPNYFSSFPQEDFSMTIYRDVEGPAASSIFNFSVLEMSVNLCVRQNIGFL